MPKNIGHTLEIVAIRKVATTSTIAAIVDHGDTTLPYDPEHVRRLKVDRAGLDSVEIGLRAMVMVPPLP